MIAGKRKGAGIPSLCPERSAQRRLRLPLLRHRLLSELGKAAQQIGERPDIIRRRTAEASDAADVLAHMDRLGLVDVRERDTAEPGLVWSIAEFLSPDSLGSVSETAVDRAAAYDAWYTTGLGAVAHRIELGLIADLAAVVRGEVVLDAGCGTGIYTAWLIQQGLEVTGLDRDPEMLDAARSRAPDATLVRGDITELPFRDDEFDLAVAVTVFCFLDQEQRMRAAHELVRVVRPGGRVVIGELGRWSLWAAERRIKGWLGSETWSDARFTSAGELERLFRATGAAPGRSGYGLYLPPVDREVFTRRSDEIERLGRPLGAIGAAFIAVQIDVPEPEGPVTEV